MMWGVLLISLGNVVTKPSTCQAKLLRGARSSQLDNFKCGVRVRRKANTPEFMDRIVGGVDAKENEIPWQVSCAFMVCQVSYFNICHGAQRVYLVINKLNRDHLTQAELLVNGEFECGGTIVSMWAVIILVFITIIIIVTFFIMITTAQRQNFLV